MFDFFSLHFSSYSVVFYQLPIVIELLRTVLETQVYNLIK